MLFDKLYHLLFIISTVFLKYLPFIYHLSFLPLPPSLKRCFRKKSDRRSQGKILQSAASVLIPQLLCLMFPGFLFLSKPGSNLSNTPGPAPPFHALRSGMEVPHGFPLHKKWSKVVVPGPFFLVCRVDVLQHHLCRLLSDPGRILVHTG